MKEAYGTLWEQVRYVCMPIYSYLYIYIYIYISETIEVLPGSMLSRIINLVSTRIIIVLLLILRNVPPQTLSKEATNDSNKKTRNIHG